MTAQPPKKRILIFTDSRGQHKPAGQNHDIFAERLAKDSSLHVDMYLCPMKWTTTLDFLERFTPEELATYDHVVLYTGIVEWSPRPESSAIKDLYDNPSPLNLGALSLNTRNYSKKIVNNKKNTFDRVFGEDAMSHHFASPFEVEYEGEITNNMYSLDMASKVIERLKRIHNLIFVNANYIVPGWEGDFKRGRPKNISVIHDYADLFANELGDAGVNLVDLRVWTDTEVKQFTCDNLHLTAAGSNWIYNHLIKIIEEPDTQTMHKNDSILLIGNGPSTKELVEFGFENLPSNLDTFGMGAAYRFFDETNWWPTYHAWCDMKVVHSHRQELKRIAEDPSVALEKLYVSLPLSSAPRLECVPHSSTGDFCFRKAIELGYRNIYFIGVEGNYVEEIPESRPLTDSEYKSLGFSAAFEKFSEGMADRDAAESLFKKYLRIITETPDRNPNYFFDHYQRKGDVYSLPRTHTHISGWEKAAKLARDSGVVAFNMSMTSNIQDFPKLPFVGALTRLKEEANCKTPIEPYGTSIGTPSPLSKIQRARIRKDLGMDPNDPIACLIIGLKISPDDGDRHRNLRYLLSWIDVFFGDLFDVLIVEQGETSSLGEISDSFQPYVRHEFIYNPGPFNRGWGYNVAARHFTEAKVLAFLDTDVLLGANFLDEVLLCFSDFKAISPYRYVYFADAKESNSVCDTFSFNGLQREDGVKKPTTITGGIVIFRRDAFLGLKGFEQYIEYAGEDRALDVTILNHLDKHEWRMAPNTYIHLHHKTGVEPRPRSSELFSHLREKFGCRVDPAVLPGEDIHLRCNHVNRKQTLQLMIERAKYFGDIDLYRRNQPLTINGQIDTLRNECEEWIFPPGIKPTGLRNLSKYEEVEKTGNLRTIDVELMSQFYNIFKGERCFIIGNGPSLNKHDLSLLEGEYSFGVNSFYYKTRETGFRPFFYVVEDTSVMHENIDEIREYQAPFRFFPTIYRDLLPESPNTFFFQMDRGFYEKSSPNYAVPRFSTDASKRLYCGQSVTYINLQLAFFMGFTEVYLIGMDFDYVIPDSHKRSGDIILSDTDDPNHFHKDYFGAGKTWKDPKLERVLMNYKMADLAFSAVGRKIYNATVGGKLEVFDRVNYETLLRSSAFSGEVPIFKSNSAHTAPNFPLEGAERASASETLRQIASELLLHPNTTANRILNGDLKATVETALSQVPAEDPVRVHFEKVKLHVSHAGQ